MKTCSKCLVEKDPSDFSKNKSKSDGLNSYCKPCMRAYGKQHRSREDVKEKRRLRQRELMRQPEYAEAQKAAQKKWSQSPEGREWARKHRLKHRDTKNEASRRWRKENPEKQRAADRSWRERNRGKANAKNMRRYAAKLKRTPLWADLVEIDYVYHAAQVIKDVYGTSWDVDHIIPLQGENVSGLHVQGNLQIMDPIQNRSKGNSFTC